MSYYINAFLSSELTCIPQFVDKYMGKYYSNTAGNALTWAFVFWNVLHLIFDVYLNVLLKKMQFKSYARKRLLNSLWCAGFYSAGFIYCAATIVRNNMSLWQYKKTLPMDGGPIPPHIMLGLGLFGSFFLHTLFWDLIKRGPEISSVTYFLLTLLPLFTYMTRRIELYLSLLAIICLVQFVFNLLRFVSTSAGPKRGPFLTWLLYANLGLFTTVHLLVVPLVFIIPLIFSDINSGFSVPLAILSVILCSWWVVEMLANPLYKYVNHCIYHCGNTSEKICPGTDLDCTLFGSRDDTAFNLHIIRKEIKQRQDKLIQKRKPKNKGVLIQTLKCMVAIKRKLVRKRNSDSSEESSDSETEKDKAEKDSGSEEEETSSDENSDLEDDEKREAEEYKEETARALMEDREEIHFRKDEEGEMKSETETKENQIDRSEVEISDGREEDGRDTKEGKYTKKGTEDRRDTKERTEGGKNTKEGIEDGKNTKETESGKNTKGGIGDGKETKEQTEGGKNVKEGIEGEKDTKERTEGGKNTKEEIEGQKDTKEQTEGRKDINEGIEGREDTKEGTEGENSTKTEIECGQNTKDGTECGKDSKEGIEGGKDTKVGSEGGKDVKVEKTEENQVLILTNEKKND